MGLISRLFQNQINAGIQQALSGRFGLSQLMNGIAIYGQNNQQSYVDGYATNDDVYSIVRKIAKTAAMVPMTVYKVKDETALKQYEWVSKQKSYSTQSLVQKELLKRKALEPVKDDNPLQYLLNNPNPLYDATEFREGVYTMRLLTGNTYVYKLLLDEGVNAGKPVELWLMPSQYVQPIITQTFPRSILGYQLQINGLEILTTPDVLHIRQFNPLFDWNGGELIGLSPLQSAHKIKNRSDAETDYSVAAFQNSGVNGIVYREDVAPNAQGVQSLGALKKEFYNEGQGIDNVRKNLFVAGKWGFTQIGISPVDMNVIESEKMTFKKLCNVYGVSDILFNNGDSSTESNVKEMVKQLYTNAVLPEVYAYRDALNKDIAKAYKDNLFIDCDITAIPELQEDMLQMAKIFSDLPIMIPNLIMNEFGFGKMDDPMMDKVYIKQGYQPIEDLSIDLPLTGDYGTGT